MKEIDTEKAIEMIKNGEFELFQLVNYFDIWGNSRDGYEVNNLCHEQVFFIGEFSGKEFIKILKEIGFLRKRFRFSCDSWSLYEVTHVRTGKPLFRLDEFHDAENGKKWFIEKIESASYPQIYTNEEKK